MDSDKIGRLIYQLRKEKGFTQVQLANQLHVSDKAVSKWERGLGCPDVSLLADLAGILDVDLEKLLSGQMEVNQRLGGNMKKLHFYICPVCGNVVTAMIETGVLCCGKKLKALEPQRPGEEEKLDVSAVEDDFFITSGHPMTREHYISFVALLTDDCLVLRKQYPEWGLEARIPAFARGKLFWYCTKHGLFCQKI